MSKRTRGIVLTRATAWAAAMDAGNRRMRAAGRSAWSAADYNAAVREYRRLWTPAREIAQSEAEYRQGISRGFLNRVDPFAAGSAA